MVQVLEEPTRECGLRNGPNRRADLRMKSMHANPVWEVIGLARGELLAQDGAGPQGKHV